MPPPLILAVLTLPAVGTFNLNLGSKAESLVFMERKSGSWILLKVLIVCYFVEWNALPQTYNSIWNWNCWYRENEGPVCFTSPGIFPHLDRPRINEWSPSNGFSFLPMATAWFHLIPNWIMHQEGKAIRLLYRRARKGKAESNFKNVRKVSQTTRAPHHHSVVQTKKWKMTIDMGLFRVFIVEPQTTKRNVLVW